MTAIMTWRRQGYPDDDFAANGGRSDRREHGDFARYVGFADEGLHRAGSARIPHLVPHERSDMRDMGPGVSFASCGVQFRPS